LRLARHCCFCPLFNSSLLRPLAIFPRLLRPLIPPPDELLSWLLRGFMATLKCLPLFFFTLLPFLHPPHLTCPLSSASHLFVMVLALPIHVAKKHLFAALLFELKRPSSAFCVCPPCSLPPLVMAVPNECSFPPNSFRCLTSCSPFPVPPFYCFSSPRFFLFRHLVQLCV